MDKRDLTSLFFSFLKETVNSDQLTIEEWQHLLPHMQRHQVAARVYKRFKDQIPAELKSEFLLPYAHNEFQNSILLQECKKMEKVLPSIRLKGMALLDDIYESYGERDCGDIDLLSTDNSITNFADLEKQMLSYNFKSHKQPRWIGADNRFAFVKSEDSAIAISVDFHLKPFWSAHPAFKWQLRDLKDGGKALDLSDQFFHLAVNWGYQDNFVSLSKLIDLKLFWRKYSSEWDWDRLHYLIQTYNFHRVFALVSRALEEVGIVDTKPLASRLPPAHSIARKIFDAEFLFTPHHAAWKYFYIKNYTKSNFREAMYYNLSWAQSVVAPRFTVRPFSR